jgi:hypothetical protein
VSDNLDTHDVDRRTGGSTDPGGARVVTARRRLMLGAAAVLPSVVTLRSGAQVASQSFNCIQRTGKTPGAMTNGAEVQRFSDVPDEWLRKKVFTGRFGRAGTRAYCTTWDQPSVLAIAELDPAAKGGTYKALLGTTWSDGQASVQIHAVCTTYSGPSQLAGAASYCYDETVEKISPAPDYYALVYVDDTGLSSSLEPGPGLSPVREACWASLLGSSGTHLG